MPTSIIAGTLITAVTAIGMFAAHLLGGRAWWQYALGGAAAVAVAGVWIGSISAGLANAVDPSTALWRGAAFGAGYGFVASLVLLGCSRFLRKLRERAEKS